MSSHRRGRMKKNGRPSKSGVLEFEGGGIREAAFASPGGKGECDQIRFSQGFVRPKKGRPCVRTGGW